MSAVLINGDKCRVAHHVLLGLMYGFIDFRARRRRRVSTVQFVFHLIYEIRLLLSDVVAAALQTLIRSSIHLYLLQ